MAILEESIKIFYKNVFCYLTQIFCKLALGIRLNSIHDIKYV